MARWTVLFVDDDASLVAALERSMRKSPFDILTATSAVQAMRTMAATTVDAIVSDHDMPETPGTELLEEVCSRWPDTVRIMLTGRPTLDIAIDAVNRGQIWRFLTKPCQPAEIELALRQGLQQRDLLLGARSLIGGVRAQEEALARLEHEHPGITALEHADDGSIVLRSVRANLRSQLYAFESIVERTAHDARLDHRPQRPAGDH